jgi:hypothetical protein
MKVLFASGALLLAALAAGCGGGPERVSQAATSRPPATSEPATSSPVTTSSQIRPAAPCGAADIFPAVRRRIGPQVVRVEVVRCQHDYVRVNALPDTSPCPPTCNETYEVYLRWTGTRWQVVDFGTGIECEDTTTLPPLPALIRRACRALGYAQPTISTTPTFQMPSRNIACALTAHLLRCDILSGLKPEPKRPCELDWVGIVLPPDGPAEPNCAGDTVYDAAAPTLAYGAMWHGASFWCESQPSGLLCVNPRSERGSFSLSRESWEAG